MQYLISANPGEPLGPVEEIASGGELSRVMLALKTSIEAPIARRRRRGGGCEVWTSQRTLVFDEIDAGIGGRAAEAVGKKLKQLSRTKQVLCITHLPQIASFADQHYLIEKTRSRRQDEDLRAATRRRERTRRNCPHDERRQADRNLAETRRADDQGERLTLVAPATRRQLARV